MRGIHRRGRDKDKGEKTRLHHTFIQKVKKDTFTAPAVFSNTVTFLSALRTPSAAHFPAKITGVLDCCLYAQQDVTYRDNQQEMSLWRK